MIAADIADLRNTKCSVHQQFAGMANAHFIDKSGERFLGMTFEKTTESVGSHIKDSAGSLYINVFFEIAHDIEIDLINALCFLFAKGRSITFGHKTFKFYGFLQ
ncbi:hypothetical protein D3C71_1112290 [compost metagenome]